jgi:uncharacterized protein YcaQ
VPAAIRLSLTDARRIAVRAQGLAEPQPRSIIEVVRAQLALQMDPTAAVARTEQLVLWSRLGAYDVAELYRLLYEQGDLFEYRAHIAALADYALFRDTMRRSPRGDGARSVYLRMWLAENASFRRYVLRELRRRGPLRSRDLEDRAVVPYRTGGWNDGKNLTMMLERLWAQGEIAIVGRDGAERIWDLAERRYPLERRLPQAEVARATIDRQLRRSGVARVDQFGFALDGRPPGWERALRGLVREGVAVPVDVGDLGGDWFAHAELLEGGFRPRTTLLSPFDKLVYDRNRTEELFGFRFRLEIYVPKAKREYGYYVLPVLHGDRLVGRIDAFFDRKGGVLRINAVYWEDGVVDIEEPVGSLAHWLGAGEVAWP